MESTFSNEPLAKGKGDKVDKRASIRVHSIRKRMADPDGISAKAVIDGIVLSGILADDSAKFVKEVSFSQEVGSKEETVIVLSLCSEKPFKDILSYLNLI